MGIAAAVFFDLAHATTAARHRRREYLKGHVHHGLYTSMHTLAHIAWQSLLHNIYMQLTTAIVMYIPRGSPEHLSPSENKFAQMNTSSYVRTGIHE